MSSEKCKTKKFKIDCYILIVKVHNGWFQQVFRCKPYPSEVTEKEIIDGLHALLWATYGYYSIDDIEEVKVRKKTIEVECCV